MNAKPVYVPFMPVSHAEQQECFETVSIQIKNEGGEIVYGWKINEIKRVWLEAEFHAIWKRKDNQLIDITIKPTPVEKILFVPDPLKKYEGYQVQSIFKPLKKTKDIMRFIELANSYYQETNKGELKYSKELIMTPKAIEIHQEILEICSRIM
ncbi:MAG: hypothetical protein HFP81_02665 [Methylococcales symbiont of Hymedesmia sp. n. MRB-2018]|nr:MAG: hypothetical protein HFP81_02665 [Methylococcales symbiont of Hymedesmia sp. n. MRB-2018]